MQISSTHSLFHLTIVSRNTYFTRNHVICAFMASMAVRVVANVICIDDSENSHVLFRSY